MFPRTWRARASFRPVFLAACPHCPEQEGTFAATRAEGKQAETAKMMGGRNLAVKGMHAPAPSPALAPSPSPAPAPLPSNGGGKNGSDNNGGKNGKNADGGTPAPQVTPVKGSTGGKEFSVEDYGGHIDRAFDDACTAAKGADKKPIVVVPKGSNIVTNPLLMRGPCGNGIVMRVDGNVALNPNIFSARKPRGVTTKVYGALYFDHIPGLEIVGGGTIDGNGEKWWRKIGRNSRPQILVVSQSNGLLISGITFK